jgi:3alpha(or 20beta)-hydroxysteroid dehydrogenase
MNSIFKLRVILRLDSQAARVNEPYKFLKYLVLLCHKRRRRLTGVTCPPRRTNPAPDQGHSAEPTALTNQSRRARSGYCFAAEYAMRTTRVLGWETMIAPRPWGTCRASRSDCCQVSKAQTKGVIVVGRVQGKVAIITGGSRGQGAAEARLLAREGAAVAVCDLLEEEGQALARDINAAGGRARFYSLDVSNEGQWQSVVKNTVDWAGKLTTLVNNAGIINRLGIVDTSVENWQRVMNVNLLGPFLGMKHCAPVMRAAGGGSIINVGSISSYLGLKDAAYTSSKTALLGLSRTGAMEFVEWGVRVNTICPGVVVTGLNAGTSHLEPMRLATPMKRYGTSEEIAQLVLFLAADESSFVTGVDIPIDGGVLAAGLMYGIKLQPDKDALASAGTA